MSEGGEVKVFKITGPAAAAYSSTGMKKARTTRKKKDKEEDESNTSPVINLSNIAAVPNIAAASNNTPNTVQVSIPLANIIKQIPTSTTINRQNAPIELPHAPLQECGDDKKFKVELKKKQATKKVQLHPKKDGPQKVAIPKKSETRKKNRKVLLGVSSLHKRMTRAKKMQKTVKDMPLDKLKEELLRKKLIKPTSKAPESVLRQIAADAQIVEGKAL